MTATGWSLNAALALAALALLYVGAEWLVRGAASLARRMYIRPIVIGLTVVAFATSAPELVVGLTSAIQSRTAADATIAHVAVGDVLGANVANIGLIIGISALIRPLRVRRSTWRRDVPAALAVHLLLLVFCLDGRLDPWEGMLLILGFLGFVAYLVRRAKDSRRAESAGESGSKRPRLATSVAWVAAGVAALAIGGNLLVGSALAIAKAAGISNLTIGITMVALLTTVPELATSTVAARRGESDLSIGNAVGSILFNGALVLGLAAVVAPIHIGPEVTHTRLPAVIALLLLLLLLMRSGLRVTRLEGAGLLACYLLFTAYCLLAGSVGY